MSIVDLPLPSLGPPTPAAGCNCSVCPFYIDNPQAREPICSGKSASCDYCGCARAEAAPRTGGPGPCGTCPIRCGSRPDIGAWMSDVGATLGFTGLQITCGPAEGMPAFVPQTDGDLIRGLDEQLFWPAYAVGMRRVFSARTSRIFPKLAGVSARVAFDVPDTASVVLSGYGLDPLVEAYWTARHRDGVIDALVSQQWDLILAPNYSMYLNQPRTEQLLNFRRNLLVAHELQAAGAAAAPCIYWARLEDLRRYLDWVMETDPAVLALNLQTFRTDSDWNEVALPGLSFLAGVLPTHIPIWATGLGNPDRLAHIRALFGGRLHVIGQNPLQYARHGKVLTADGIEDIHARTLDAFTHNVRYYAHLMEGTP